MPKKILAPLDGSARAEQALPLVKKLLSQGGEATLLSVVDTPSTTLEEGSTGLQRQLPLQAIGDELCRSISSSPASACEEERLLRYLDQSGRPLIATGRPVRAAVLHGEPAQKISDFAKAGQFNLIVMATHVRGDLSEADEGSVAAAVRRSGVAPVLTVPPENDSELLGVRGEA